MNTEIPVLDEEFDEVDVCLEFVDFEEDITPDYIQHRAREALEEFEFSEILAENEMDEEEALGFLFEMGMIGLPTVIEDEEVEDREETED